MWYEDILNVELVIDDSVAYQSSLSSATGRAIVGDVTRKKNNRKVVQD